ncbi:conjugal transfer protein [Castellaniella sp. UC4442_H9]
MKSILLALALASALGGCAFVAPQAPIPPDGPRVPVNATAPQPGAYQ